MKRTWTMTEEIDRFGTVAKALTDEGCDGEYVIRILIRHLRIIHEQSDQKVPNNES